MFLKNWKEGMNEHMEASLVPPPASSLVSAKRAELGVLLGSAQWFLGLLCNLYCITDLTPVSARCVQIEHNCSRHLTL